MKPSPLRHPLAVLRLKIGLSQDEMADAVACPLGTLKSIEIRRRELTEEMAAQVANATWVNLGWLLDGDPKAPIIDLEGKPYQPVLFELAQSAMCTTNLPIPKDLEDRFIEQHASEMMKRFRASFLKATTSGRFHLFVWRVNKLLEQAEREYTEYEDKKSRAKKEEQYMIRYRRGLNERGKKKRKKV